MEYTIEEKWESERRLPGSLFGIYRNYWLLIKACSKQIFYDKISFTRFIINIL